ncbi:MAG: MFS transporter [Candidatus Hodarchaeota archaeon]
MIATTKEMKPHLRRQYIHIVLLFGLISLCGDIVYEGARGIVPPYLVLLGATALVIGIVGGLGDFIGYSLRFITGRQADATHRYWTFVFLGYGLTFLVVPLLGVTRALWLAVILLILERLGKAIRTPSRDVLLSAVSKEIGRGKAFGVAEALDQIGAFLGPLFVAAALVFWSSDVDNPNVDDYVLPFGILLLPGILALMILLLTYDLYPKTTELTVAKTKYSNTAPSTSLSSIPQHIWLYSLTMATSVFGLFGAFFILYRAGEIPSMPSYWIPLLYLFAMAVDAIFALIFGVVYDRCGIPLIAISFIFVALIPIVALSKTVPTMILAAAFFGIVMGIQESIVRAAVADLSEVETRGLSYGLFYLFYGVAFLSGGILIGLIYELGMLWIVGLALVTQVVALLFLGLTQRSFLKATADDSGDLTANDNIN